MIIPAFVRGLSDEALAADICSLETARRLDAADRRLLEAMKQAQAERSATALAASIEAEGAGPCLEAIKGATKLFGVQLQGSQPADPEAAERSRKDAYHIRKYGIGGHYPLGKARKARR